MGIEQECREAWRAFAEKARQAEKEGLLVALPRRLADNIAISATASFKAGEADEKLAELLAAKDMPPAEEIETIIEPREDVPVEIPAFRRNKKEDA